MDVSNKEQMMVCIRWVNEDFSVHEDPVELIHLPKTDSNMLTCALKDSLGTLSFDFTVPWASV